MSKKQATYDDALYWTVEDVGEWLQQVGFYEYVEPIQKANINGKELFELSENRLRRLYPNMPTGKSDPASMLWKQINKVKENRRTGKKPNLFGWGSEKKRPPRAPAPDYRQNQPNRQATRDGGSDEEDDWGSDFDDEEDNPGFEQTEDTNLSQGNTQGRATSYNGSSTSSFTNLSSSASGKEDDSMMYEAPNTEGDFDQTYEVPSEQMNSSYGDGDCDEIYDVPHEEEEDSNTLQPEYPKRHGGRSSPLPPQSSPRHEARPLPTLPPGQQSSWQQQQQHQSTAMEFPGPRGGRQMPQPLQRPYPSPKHFQRPPEIAPKEEEEQENYEVPSIEVLEENYEAPMIETQQEEDEEEEYLVPVESTSFKPQRGPVPPPGDSGGLLPRNRPPAPLPSAAGSGPPPPRPVKPPALTFTPSSASEEAQEAPPPIPTRPTASRQPIESKGFTTKVLPDPPPQAIRDVVSRSSGETNRDKSPLRSPHNLSNGSADENRNSALQPPLPRASPKLPPPVPRNIKQGQESSQEKNESTANGGGTISKRLQQFQSTNDKQETTRPAVPGNKPNPASKPWQKPTGGRPWAQTPNPDVQSQASMQSKWSAPAAEEDRSQHSQSTAPPQPALRSRFRDKSPAREAIPTPPIPTKEPVKIKKYISHGNRAQPDLPKPIPKDEPSPPPPAPQKLQSPVKPTPHPPKQTLNDMTGYPWYDADLNREEAVAILKQTKMDGAFVVRNSSKADDSIPYSLSLWYNNKVRNLHIRRREDGKFALGTYKDNEQVFDTAVLLIQHHMTNPLILAGDAGKTCLKVAAPNFR